MADDHDLATAFARIDERDKSIDHRITEVGKRIDALEMRIVARTEIELLITSLKDLAESIDTRVTVLEESARKSYRALLCGLISVAVVVLGAAVVMSLGLS